MMKCGKCECESGSGVLHLIGGMKVWLCVPCGRLWKARATAALTRAITEFVAEEVSREP